MALRIRYTPDAVLDKLIAAGLGDVPQSHITRDQFERAMRGEKVTLTCQCGMCRGCRRRAQMKRAYRVRVQRWKRNRAPAKTEVRLLKRKAHA